MSEESEANAGDRRFPPLTIFAWISLVLAVSALFIPPAGLAIPIAFAAAGFASAGLELTSAEETGCLATLAAFLNFVLLGSLLMLSFATVVL